MAKGGGDITSVVLWGVLGVAGYQLAESGQLGTGVKQWVDQHVKNKLGPQQPAPAGQQPAKTNPVPSNGGGNQSGGGSNADTGWVALNLVDWGTGAGDGFPVEYKAGRIRQRRDLGGTNEYSPPAIFFNALTGQGWQWNGGGSFINDESGPADVGSFVA